MSLYYMIRNEIGHMVIPCAVSFPFIMLSRFLIVKKQKQKYPNIKVNIAREAAIVIFWIYIVALLSVTFVPEYKFHQGFERNFFILPDFSDPDTIILRPPIGWIEWKISTGEYTDLVRNIAGNIIIFMPYGFLVPYIWKKLKAKTILFGFLLSFFIEFAQLFMYRQTDINDIIMNTMGTAAGYLTFIALKAVVKKVKKSKKAKAD